MSQGLVEIHDRVRAADPALALSQGGSSELAQVRQAVGSLLIALHELTTLWERRELAPGGRSVEAPSAGAARGKGARQ